MPNILAFWSEDAWKHCRCLVTKQHRTLDINGPGGYLVIKSGGPKTELQWFDTCVVKLALRAWFDATQRKRRTETYLIMH